jgi:putative aldouronate transport system permease protein
MLIPVVLYFILFHYVPMGGIIIAFKRYVPKLGLLGSKWVEFRYFREFFQDLYFGRLMSNTFLLNVYDIIVGFPMPILLALMLNELRSRRYKTAIQTSIYMPNFVSVIVLCGIILDFCARDGAVNDILAFFGIPRSALLGNPALFKPIFIISNLWQYAGWSSIIYSAALAGINCELYDAAYVDGCNRFGRILHVTIPGLMPTVIIMLILRMGNIMTVGFEKVVLLYNPLTYESADVISSYVYRRGILEGNYSYSTAVGLFNSLINFAFLYGANWFSRRITEESLW